MILIEDIPANPFVPGDSERDVLLMGWEQRRLPRQRAKTMHGREVAIALPTGSVLLDGEIVYVGTGFVISVEAEKEDVLAAVLKDPAEAAGLAYELGNRHLPLSVGEEVLAAPYDRLVEELFRKSGMPYERRKEKFEPRRVAHGHG